jgi:hypothetical protein
MTLDRRSNTRASKHVKGAASSHFASIQERRVMKKVAQPEHAYTGCVPYTPDDAFDAVPKKKNPPILGYRGHLRHDEDRIGTTFTQGLAVASRAAEPVFPLSSAKTRPPNNQARQVRFAEDKAHLPKAHRAVKAVGISPRSGYGQFDNASEYGNFAAPPGMSPRSGYSAFENASGYGAFAPPPAHANMSPRSGYAEFENASGYGAFAAAPKGMSPRSGYAEFENASGYGAFAAPPAHANMSPRSGYAEFENASGYGAFAAAPKGMSPRSGYAEFENASGYGAFAAPPDPAEKNETINRSAASVNPVGAGRCGNKTRSPNNQLHDSPRQHRDTGRRPASSLQTLSDPVLLSKYRQAVARVGGEQAALRQWTAASQTVWQRHTKRTELLQSVKRSFEKHERTSAFERRRLTCEKILKLTFVVCIFAGVDHGFMSKAQLKEALRDLACVFTDDQVRDENVGSVCASKLTDLCCAIDHGSVWGVRYAVHWYVPKITR